MQYAQPLPPVLQPSDLSCDLVGMSCSQYSAAYTYNQFFCSQGQLGEGGGRVGGA